MDRRDPVEAGLRRQVDEHPPLPVDTVARLLVAARDEPRGSAEATLIRHHLGIALDQALHRRDSEVEIGDLFQEASLAVVTAVEEYAGRGGRADGLGRFVSQVVALHLDAAVEREADRRRIDEALVRDTRLFEAAEVALRRRLGRPATTLELAGALEWPPERVELLSAMLADARALHDRSLIPFLDDIEPDPGGDDGDADPALDERPR